LIKTLLLDKTLLEIFNFNNGFRRVDYFKTYCRVRCKIAAEPMQTEFAVDATNDQNIILIITFPSAAFGAVTPQVIKTVSLLLECNGKN